MPLVVCGQPRFWSRWPVTQRGVRSDGVVVDAPAFRQHTQFLDRVENFSVEEFIPQVAIERFTVAVLPGRAGFDVQCLCSGVGQPLAGNSAVSRKLGKGKANSKEDCTRLLVRQGQSYIGSIETLYEALLQ